MFLRRLVTEKLAALQYYQLSISWCDRLAGRRVGGPFECNALPFLTLYFVLQLREVEIQPYLTRLLLKTERLIFLFVWSNIRL